MPMPRLARLDAPGILHLVIGRGIEQKKIFFNDTDRSDFIDRLTDIAEEGAMDATKNYREFAGCSQVLKFCETLLTELNNSTCW